MEKYYKRIADELLKDKLESKGAVVIEGPKWCGKTSTALEAAKSVIRMDDPAKRDMRMRLAEMNPGKLLSGDTPRLIDEWQIAPTLWDAARYEVDTRQKQGQFIFTGSAVPVESKEITHSGTGRFTWLKMRPMSLYESMESTGEVSLSELFDEPTQINGSNSVDIDDLAFYICRGGWPQAIDMSKKAALTQSIDYYDAVVKSDINRADGVNRQPERVKRLMRSLARLQGSQASKPTITADIKVNDNGALDDDTVGAYIEALKKIYVVEDMSAWSPNLRSKTTIRTSDTRYYVDPSIATAALGIGPNDLVEDIKTMGFMFETLCTRDMRVYADAIDAQVYHYRDKDNLECDMVVHRRDGKYGLVEVKLGGETAIQEGVDNLLSLREKIDIKKMKEPSFMAVLVGVSEYAYRRQDGIYIVPIGCLKD